MSTNNEISTVSELLPKKKFFTVEQANKALPYVSRIAQDIRDTYRKALDFQQRIEFPTPGEDIDSLQDEYQKHIEMLTAYVEELQKVGVDLKDYSLGLIDFPGLHEGREVCLCWRFGEENIVAWHEVDAGFAGRQDISSLNETTE